MVNKLKLTIIEPTISIRWKMEYLHMEISFLKQEASNQSIETLTTLIGKMIFHYFTIPITKRWVLQNDLCTRNSSPIEIK